jgi:glycosyltransferase involved in cell wall biosynthesis
MHDDPFISVIVPVYNGEKFLPRCLEALFAADYRAFEVIVVDDGSTDESANIARAGGAEVISSERRQSGPAAVRNLAAQRAKGEILLFVDSDVVVRGDALRRIAAHFQKDEALAAVFGSYDDAPAEQNFLSQYRNLLHHFVHQTSNPEASTFWAGLGAIRKTVFSAAGGFDAVRYAVPSIEDIELGVRLKARRQRILLDRDLQGKHLKKWTARSILQTDIFCRAAPWSKLILTRQGLINDLNLKTADRVSTIFVAATLACIPFVFRQPLFLLLITALLLVIFVLNRHIFRFCARCRGIWFAIGAFPWQFLYFLYSGVTFGVCWLIYALAPRISFGRVKPTINQSN